MRHPKLIRLENRLKKVFDSIDDYLEERYGSLYTLHPARARKGTTANKSQDGLFNVGASFSAGFGSRLGRGYVVDVSMVTLEQVPHKIKKKIEEDVVRLLKEMLPEHLPGRELNVTMDGNVIKIYGDFSLGMV